MLWGLVIKVGMVVMLHRPVRTHGMYTFRGQVSRRGTNPGGLDEGPLTGSPSGNILHGPQELPRRWDDGVVVDPTNRNQVIFADWNGGREPPIHGRTFILLEVIWSIWSAPPRVGGERGGRGALVARVLLGLALNGLL